MHPAWRGQGHRWAIWQAALALVERHGWQPVFKTARMYAGPAPTLDLARIYGVTSFELG